MKRMLTRIFFLIALGSIIAHPFPAIAQDAGSEQYGKKLAEIEELKKKLSAVQQESKTLASAISYINLKQTLTQKQIDATIFQIELLEKEIDSLSGKIGVLEGTLNTLTAALLVNVEESYKHRDVDGFEILLSQRNFSDIVSTYRYLQAAQKYRQDLLIQTTQTKIEYDQEKDTKEKKQKEMAQLKQKYEKQKQELVEQKQAKQILLSQTKNSEGNYQRLLAQAQAELASMRAFTAGKGGGLLPPQNSPDGWFFSQRDERWGNMCIGLTCMNKNPDTIMQVGCLISSVAMVKKKYGEDVNPAGIASVNEYFSLNTASMRRPWPAPSGKSWDIRDRYDSGAIDSELSAGRPVIVKLSVKTNVVGTHFIVLKSGGGGKYVMHDPWEGYDKDFNQFYSTGQIISTAILK